MYAVPLNNEVVEEAVDKQVTKEVESRRKLRTRLVIGHASDSLYIGFSRKYQELIVEKDVFEDIKVSSIKVPRSLAVPL